MISAGVFTAQASVWLVWLAAFVIMVGGVMIYRSIDRHFPPAGV